MKIALFQFLPECYCFNFNSFCKMVRPADLYPGEPCCIPSSIDIFSSSFKSGSTKQILYKICIENTLTAIGTEGVDRYLKQIEAANPIEDSSIFPYISKPVPYFG